MKLDQVLATQRDTVLIGVDGGASGFRAYEIVVRGTKSAPRLALGERSAAEAIEPVADFSPKSVERQLEEARASAFEFTREERMLQGRWIHAASRAVSRLAASSGRDSLRLGVCAPGVKSRDGRGIEVSLNGPRIPDFVDALEQSLALDGLHLARPIARVISDGWACGLGENLAPGGLFADIDHGYYLGGGSGVAEAYKLRGSVRSADDLSPELAKAWQMRAEDGTSFESALSVAGINRAFGLVRADAAHADMLPENAAANGDPRARALFESCAQHLAELAGARLSAVLEVHGVILERIVVAQRLGKFFLDPRLMSCFAEPACAALARRLQDGSSDALRAAWLEAGALRNGILVGSDLRAASALGALALELESD